MIFEKRRTKMNENYNKTQESLYGKIYEQLFYNSENNKVDESEEKFSKLCERYQMRRPKMILANEERALKCLNIRMDLRENKPLNVEINLDTRFVFQPYNKILELKETVIRYCAGDMSKPDYIVSGNNKLPTASVFINERDAFLAIRDKSGVISYLELVDFYLVAIVKDVVRNEEYGFVLEYRCFDDSTCREFNSEIDLEQIKELFFENWFSNRITRIQKIFIKNAYAAMHEYE